MGSRMDKYYENTGPVGSRSKKNEELYQEISQSDLDAVNLSSNAHVIGDSDSDLDIGKIKKLLEKKYYEEPKKVNTLYHEEDFLDEEDISEEETKEYDINAILQKAKLDKEVDYERERLKKIHDTQYDILKNLDLKKEEEEEQESKVTSNKEDLMNLINTITEKEMTRGLNPLDILTDLKGSDNTEVLAGVSEKVNEEIAKENQVSAKRDNLPKDDPKKNIDKTFYTNSLSFTQSDFDDFNDLKEDMETNKILVRVLLIIVAIALIVGILFLVNTMFNLNWF